MNSCPMRCSSVIAVKTCSAQETDDDELGEGAAVVGPGEGAAGRVGATDGSPAPHAAAVRATIRTKAEGRGRTAADDTYIIAERGLVAMPSSASRRSSKRRSASSLDLTFAFLPFSG
jgi:hypothetical protein